MHAHGRTHKHTHKHTRTDTPTPPHKLITMHANVPEAQTQKHKYVNTAQFL